MKRFEFVGGGSSKFWEIGRDGAEVTVRFGRIGSSGQTQTKAWTSDEEARSQVAKLIREKLAKGYAEVSDEDSEGELPTQRGESQPWIRPPGIVRIRASAGTSL